MSWKNDDHGIAFQPSECKLYGPSHTWGMKISRIGVSQFPNFVGVMTFSFQVDYAARQLSRLPDSFWFVCNAKFTDKARKLKGLVPQSRVFVCSAIHQKLVLIPDETVHIGSLNMVNQHSTGNSESTIGVRSKDAYEWALVNLWDPVIGCSSEII